LANRFQINQHRIAYNFCKARDGERCLICGRVPPAVRLEIDHADGDERNWEADNLHLLCKNHNIGMRGLPAAEHVKLILAYSAKNVCVREREVGCESTLMSRENIDYSSGSAEMKANNIYEMRFREWVLTEVNRLGSLPLKEAVNSGAEVVGCNPVTASRYLDKLTSAIGPLERAKDNSGNILLRLKPRKLPAMPRLEFHDKP